MSYRIVMDSCGELTNEMQNSGKIVSVPLTLEVNGKRILDDETFDQTYFLAQMAESDDAPRSSCPSPEAYMEAYHCEAERIYVITLSGALSGSYNSATLAKNLYPEEYEEEKTIHVFNSKSASGGETLVAKKIMECEAKGLSYEKVIAEVEAYIAEMKTYFILESLENLRKNGRLTGLKALMASALNIKPIMSADENGMIYQISQARGMKKGLKKMIDVICEATKYAETKSLVITHVNARERAEVVKNMLEKKMPLKEIFILDTKGVSSMYAEEGGIIIAL